MGMSLLPQPPIYVTCWQWSLFRSGWDYGDINLRGLNFSVQLQLQHAWRDGAVRLISCLLLSKLRFPGSQRTITLFWLIFIPSMWHFWFFCSGLISRLLPLLCRERSVIYRAVKRFPHCDISSTVQDETTHVVCGAPRRTLNVLKAIAHGAWLLSKEWVWDMVVFISR